MKQLLAIFLCIFMLTACHRQAVFEVSGELTDAGGQNLYLEQLGLTGTKMLDSCQIKDNGAFRLKGAAPGNPEIFRLRMGQQVFVFTVDSIENIQVTSSAGNFRYATVSGSDKTAQITGLRQSLNNNDSAVHKQFAKDLILQDPRSIVAYYALFQQKNGTLVFNLYEKEDRPYYSAVATAWHAFMPNNERSKALYNLVNDAIQQERKQQNQALMQQFIEQAEPAFLDIELPDENGKIRHLSDLKGEVILLDFSAVGMENSTAYIFELRELYNRYHTKGFQIFSVSADNNRLMWEDSARNLPWITVRGENGSGDKAFLTYNVQNLPTIYLFDRQGQITGRYNNFDRLEKVIETCLR